MSKISRTTVGLVGTVDICRRNSCSLKNQVHTLYSCVLGQLRQQCRQANCQITSVHALEVCNPNLLDMLKSKKFTPCNNESCFDTKLHGDHDCDPRLTPCLREEHKGAGEHLVIDCIDNATYDDKKPGKELVLYTRHALVHAPTVPETPANDEPLENFQGCPDQENCPIKGDHLADQPCATASRKPQQKLKSNKVTAMMRAKSAIKNTWLSLGNIDLVELIASIPLLIGAALTVLTMFTFVVAVEELTPLAPVHAIFVFLCVYIPSLMGNLSFWTRHLTFPGGTRFDCYINRLSFGTAIITSSLLLWVIAIVGGILMQR